jgi:hypothetical protein
MPPPTTSIVPWTTSVTPFAERSNQRIVIVAQAAVRSGTNRIVTAVLQVILDHRDRDDFLVTAAHAIRLSWALSLLTPSAPNVGRALAASRLASADASHDTPDGDEFRFYPCPRMRCLRSVIVFRSGITGAAAKPKCTRWATCRADRGAAGLEYRASTASATLAQALRSGEPVSRVPIRIGRIVRPPADIALST